MTKLLRILRFGRVFLISAIGISQQILSRNVGKLDRTYIASSFSII